MSHNITYAMKKSKSPAAMMVGAAVALGFAGVSFYSSSAGNKKSLEQQFGTADGQFPTATPGANLSNPPGNKDMMVGEGMEPGFKLKDSGVDARPNATR
jgi:hypothetical protein